MRSAVTTWTVVNVLGTLVILGETLIGQEPLANEGELTRIFPTAVATLVDEAPVLDGEVLNDPIWAKSLPVTGFVQITPDEGQPATERTAVHVIYTSDTLFFGVVCYDRNPSSIIVADSRRDSDLRETDSFQIILDTFLDQQNGFVFGTNPVGIEYDAQVTNEGQGSGSFGRSAGRPGQGRQQRGAGGGLNLNWDGSWQVRAKVSEIGWTAEFAIPFRTLRYPPAISQTWGINFQRNIRRRNETSFWAQLPRQFNLYRLSLAGELTGLELPEQRNLKLIPYVLSEALQSDPNLPNSRTLSKTEWGGDLKYSITPGLTLDATVNTDFAQVEVDEQQINLDRFNLFFPEKRPVFLENAGLFAVGIPGQTEVFFSRQIGIGPNGEIVPIRAGGRLSGNVSSLNVGLLNMQTGAVEGLTPGNNYSVIRLRRDLRNRSNIGGIFVNRQATGERSGEKDYNRSYAVDGRFGIGQNGLISGFAAVTETPGVNSDQHAFNLAGNYNSEAWRLRGGYTEVGNNFNPEVGFLTRRGFRRADALILHTYRPKNFFLNLHEIRPHISHFTFWNFDGFQETVFTHMDTHWAWENGAAIYTGFNLTREGVTEPFEVSHGITIPAGTYAHEETQFMLRSNQGASVSARIQTTIGGFFGGGRVRVRPSVIWRIGETFNTELSWDRNDIDLPMGSFVTNLAGARISYSFTPRVLVQSLIQYNDRAKVWSTNLRFSWLQQANTGLFIVYNDMRGLASLMLMEPNGLGRSLTIKYAKMFDVLN